MQRFSIALLALTIASAPAVSSVAQNTVVSASNSAGSSYVQSEAAPVVRQAPDENFAPQENRRRQRRQEQRIESSQPVHGVMVRADHPNALHTVTADATRTELRLDRGRANVMVHDPAPDMLLLVDLPGGQTQLLKNGFYTFNANTNTVRVLSGEADAFVATSDNPVKVKGDDQLVFAGAQTKVSYSDPYYTRQDVLPGNSYAAEHEPGYGASPDYGYYGYGPYAYADGYYGYPYGYPYYAWADPYWGWGYPGWGFGYGWGGGLYLGGYGGYGYRGGYGRGIGGGRGYPGGGVFHPGTGSFHGGGSSSFHGGSNGGGAAHGGGGHR